MVVAADAHAARSHDQVGRCGGAAQRSLDRLGIVADPLQEQWLATGFDHRRRQRRPVRVVDLPGPSGSPGAMSSSPVERIATSGRLPDRRRRSPGRQHGQPSRRAAARPAGPRLRRRVSRGRPHERAGPTGTARRRRRRRTPPRPRSGRRRPRRAAEARRSRSGPPSRPRPAGGSRAGSDLAGDTEGAGRIGGAQREAVHRGVGERRDVDRGDDPRIGEDPPGGIGQGNAPRPVGRACASRRAWASSSGSIGPQPVRFSALMSFRIPAGDDAERHAAVGSTTAAVRRPGPGSGAARRPSARRERSSPGPARAAMSVTRANGQSSRASRTSRRVTMAASPPSGCWTRYERSSPPSIRSLTSSATVSFGETAGGFGSIASRTRTPFRLRSTPACMSVVSAAFERNQPMTASHRPLTIPPG